MNYLELLSYHTTIVLINGYFGENMFFKYNVRTDDFINIISKYLKEKPIKLIEHVHEKRNLFNCAIDNLAILNKQFVAAIGTLINHSCVMYVIYFDVYAIYIPFITYRLYCTFIFS